MRVLSAKDVEKAVPLPRAIELVRDAFRQLAEGKALAPLRTVLRAPGSDATTLSMPGWVESAASVGVKLAHVHPGNPSAGRPRVHAVMLLCDAATGEPQAALEATFLTALRTAAATAVATELLARRDAKVAALFGAGLQARHQLGAIASVRSIETAWVYAPHKDRAEEFLLNYDFSGPAPKDLRVAEHPTQALRDADLIVTATNSPTPVFDGNDVKPGAHVNGIGSFTPQAAELDAVLLRRASKIVVDQREAAWAEAGDLIQARDKGILQETDVYAELGELVLGRKPAREQEHEITVFKSVGNAVQDVVVAEEALRMARKWKLGIEVAL